MSCERDLFAWPNFGLDEWYVVGMKPCYIYSAILPLLIIPRSSEDANGSCGVDAQSHVPSSLTTESRPKRLQRADSRIEVSCSQKLSYTITPCLPTLRPRLLSPLGSSDLPCFSSSFSAAAARCSFRIPSRISGSVSKHRVSVSTPGC